MKKLVVTVIALCFMLAMSMSVSAATFNDVPSSHSLAIEIEYLANTDVINGYPDGTFKPNAPIAKKHIAAMFVKALNLPTTNLQNPGYKDVPITHPYYTEIAAGYTAGLFSKADYFKPESSISRAFMAKIIAKGFNLKSIAHNAVTYRDVATTSEFYRPIQLVTMNNVAQGYTISAQGSHYYQFKPNQLLTRAHFSAFLARAMSLKAGDYTANTNYTYYYEDMTDRYSLTYTRQEQQEYGINTFWKHQAVSKDERYDITYLNSISGWVYGIPNSDGGVFTEKPFTIGVKYDYEALGELMYETPTKQEILSTNERVNVAGTTYNDVIVLKNYYKLMDSTYETITIYIAKGYGMIGLKNTKGFWYYWLDERVAR